MKLKISFFLVLLSFGMFSASYAEETQLDKLSMGEYWHGAIVNKKDLLGKVVVLELWGLN